MFDGTALAFAADKGLEDLEVLGIGCWDNVFLLLVAAECLGAERDKGIGGTHVALIAAATSALM
jgi:hypothetical protein